MRPSLWPEREPVVRRFAGKIKADDIAKMLDMNTNTLRFHCRKHGVSLKCEAVQKRVLEQARAARQTARMIAHDSPVTMSIDVESIYRIPAMPFRHVYMGNFT